MIRRQLFDAQSSTYTYLLGDERSGLAMIIDPVIERLSDYLAVLDELDLKLDLSIETHTHADHVSAQSALRKTTACRILVSRESRARCNCGTFDDTLVYPGHDYHSRHLSTIGNERMLNPRLQVDGKDEYIELMNGLNLPPPKLMKRALAVSSVCGNLEAI